MIASNEEVGEQQASEKQAPEESIDGVSPPSDRLAPGTGALAFAHDTLERPLRRVRRNMCTDTMDSFADHYPRLFAIFCGILIPLFALIALATLFGYWISQIESPVEISYNDYQLAIWSQQNVRLQILSDLTAVTPRICLRLFLQNYTAEKSSSPWDSVLNLTSATVDGVSNNETLFLVKLGYLIAEEYLPDSVSREYSVLNVSEVYSFLTRCGASIQAGIKNYTALTVVVPDSDAGATLTFNWNRCSPYRQRDPNFTVSVRPANQSAFYTQNWIDNATAIYDKYYEYYTTAPQNLSSPLASALASNRSFFEATGAKDCVVNQYAGGTAGRSLLPICLETLMFLLYFWRSLVLVYYHEYHWLCKLYHNCSFCLYEITAHAGESMYIFSCHRATPRSKPQGVAHWYIPWDFSVSWPSEVY
jgi:hypothetical protein